MAKDPAFLFYPGDYLRDVQMLSANAHVAYDRIMCEHMRNICISQRQLNFITKLLLPEEKEELMSVLQKHDDGFQIEWVSASIYKRRLYSESRAKNRKKKNENISKHMKNICEHMENENENENRNEYINKSIEIENPILWTSAKNSFLNSDEWKYQFCTSKKVSKAKLEKYMDEFIADCELKTDYKDLKELKKHFTNWFNLKNKSNGKGLSEVSQQRQDAYAEYVNRHRE